MVYFSQSKLEKKLTLEEMEKERLHAIENSNTWKKHVKLHKKAGMGKPQLHISGEPLFGEEDAVLKRMGLPQRTQQDKNRIVSPINEPVYGISHNAPNHIYIAPGSQPGLWASCNCGAEFKAEEKENKLNVTSYGVVGSDNKATSYAVSSSSYGGQQGSLTYNPNTSKNAYL